MKKSIKIAILLLLLIIFMIPVEIDGRYEAVLWGRKREMKIVENNLGGISDHVRYYYVYKYRIIFFTITVEDSSNIDTAQL